VISSSNVERKCFTLPLVLAIILTPMFPIGAIVLLLYILLFKHFRKQIIYLTLAYTVFPLFGFSYIASLITALYATYLNVKGVDKYFLLYIASVGAFSTYTSYYVPTIVAYISMLESWIVQGSPWYIPVHLALLSATATYTLTYMTPARETFAGKILLENPGNSAIIQFIIFLMAAATYLALGSESLANRLAELAYYSLVLGVTATLFTIVHEGSG